jgi:transcriptional regulator of nitric oxide reductase
LVSECIALAVGDQELDDQHVPFRHRALDVVLAVDADGLPQVKNEVLLFLVARSDIFVVRRSWKAMQAQVTLEGGAVDIPVQAVG